MLRKNRIISCALALLGSAILAFGLYHVHSVSSVTEGGALGLTLLLDHWLGISPAITGLVLNLVCYLLGWRTLGRGFLIYSAISAAGFSLFYGIFEQYPPLWPALAEMPAAAAVLGALFVGIGVGLCVRVGGAPTADDALAMSLSKLVRMPIEWVYLASDLVVLALSATYIPWRKLIWSLLTVILSGRIIGLIQRFGKSKEINQGKDA
ncbi:MAG: YitT family protein [Firmicutes bacterium]|nr:YitT family protein [Bacillota bacterium]